MSRTDAVEALYSDMAARHRARFRSIHVSCGGTLSGFPLMTLTQATDPPRRRAREDRGYQAPLHQAAGHQGPQVPPPPPRPQDQHQEGFQREAAGYFCLSGFIDGWGRQGFQVFITDQGNSLCICSLDQGKE